MHDLLKTMSAAASGMTTQSARLRLSAENLANADTPGYRRKIVAFEQVMTDEGAVVKTGRLTLSEREGEQIYDPSHPLADAEGLVVGSNVDMMVELADSREAQRSYEANLRIFDQARQMTSSLIDLLRR